MKKIILLAFLLLTLTGCKPIIMAFYGISPPKEISNKKIEKKKKKYDLDYFKHYYITEKGFYHYFDVLAKNNFKTNPTRFLIFKNGKLLQPIVAKVCPTEDYKFIKNLPDSMLYIVIDSIFLSNFVNNDNLYNFNIEEFEQENKNKEFTIILYWATFAGKFNKTITAQLAQAVKENKRLSVHAFYVNLDIKEDWKEKTYK
jgi:hypothetical protein